MLPAFFSSLQVRLLLLLLLALLPGFAMTFYLGFEQRQQAIANAQAGALQLARVTAANQSRLLDAERQLLVTIAELPVVLIGDAAACHARFADLRQQYPRYVNLTVVTPARILSGQVLYGGRDLLQRRPLYAAGERGSALMVPARDIHPHVRGRRLPGGDDHR